jgi:hypothetical protein
MSNQLTYDFILFDHGHEPEIKLGHGTLEEGTALVNALEARWGALEDSLGPDDDMFEALAKLPADDPLRHYEGCEISAVSDLGVLYFIDGWQV